MRDALSPSNTILVESEEPSPSGQMRDDKPNAGKLRKVVNRKWSRDHTTLKADMFETILLCSDEDASTNQGGMEKIEPRQPVRESHAKQRGAFDQEQMKRKREPKGINPVVMHFYGSLLGLTQKPIAHSFRYN